MANFNLADYETVDSRIHKFYADHPEGRIITENTTSDFDRDRAQWIIKSSVYFDKDDHAAGLPKATGWAFEIDGGAGANKMAALENCETSSIGRALANAGYSGDKRASAEEMAKANRAKDAPTPPEGWRKSIADAQSLPELLAIHNNATQGGWALPEVMSALTARKAQL